MGQVYLEIVWAVVEEVSAKEIVMEKEKVVKVDVLSAVSQATLQGSALRVTAAVPAAVAKVRAKFVLNSARLGTVNMATNVDSCTRETEVLMRAILPRESVFAILFKLRW